MFLGCIQKLPPSSDLPWCWCRFSKASMPRRGKERCHWSPLWSSLRRAESGGFTQNLGAKNKVPAPKRCHAFVSFFLHCLYTCLLRLLGLVGWVGWGNNVLALPYLMYFSCAYVIHLGWGWLTWGLFGQQRPCTCVLNILFLCLRHALGFGLVDLRWVVTFLHLRRISIIVDATSQELR